jgi:uncharacterized membrane protein YgdD (TMEM256/DUF423 family)
VLGWLLVLSGLLHAFGSWTGYRNSSETLLWALSGSLAALLVAALNLLRVNRPADRPLALVALAGALAWTGIALGFGAVISNALDPRAVIHAVIAVALAGMSLRTVLGSNPNSPHDAA